MKATIELLKDYMLKPKGMMVWRDIPEYEGRYQISNHGDVCSILNKLVSENDTQVLLIRIDKSRHTISRKKLLKTYWKEINWYQGEEEWKKLDHYGDYYVSNYANVKNCRRLVLWPTQGRVTLIDGGERKIVSVLSLFLSTFPPYEIEIDDENKTVNYKKKDANIVTAPIKRTA